ncbi:hypothetical protein J437_LFUL001696 [Ladona fulva]|uniref:Uncharacterized protein n=1 Tax=Ladona fulva TaxID=123851 RepID=A0A8K0NZ71_LADFU|nr:hypothetical protein J437_LFUL001696 [Ladona fulva]
MAKFQKGESKQLDASFKTENKRVLRVDNTVLVVEDSYAKLLKEKSEFQAKGSGWTFSEIVCLELRINKYTPLRGSTYIELPSKIRNTKSVVNVKNNDMYCFTYAVWAKNIDKNPQRVSKYDTRSFHNGYQWDCIEYLVDLKDIIKFEQANNITINVFGLDEKKNNVYPIRIVDHEMEDHCDLLYLTNDETSHYCRIKNFERLVHLQITKNNNGIYICKRCFVYYHDEEKLESHKPNCYNNIPAKIALPTEEDKILKFNKIGHTFRVPYAIYADFESILLNIEGWDPNPADSYSNKFQKHEAYSFCYVMVTSEGFEKPVLYRSPNAAKIFISKMKGEAEKIAVRYRNIVPMNPFTTAQEESFRMEVNCHICSKPLGDDRVMDHCHLTGKFRGLRT